MFVRKFVFVWTLFLCFGGSASAQSPANAVVPLLVDEGFPLQVVLAEKLRFKEDEVVLGRIIEPVYAFDREVIPSGTEILGRIAGFAKAGKWKRFFTMLAGDFTPLKEPQITFDELVLPGGMRIPIDASVKAGAEKVVQFGSDKLISTTEDPGKERLKSFFWSLSPYRPQSLPAGTSLTATLLGALKFGSGVFDEGALDRIGSEPAAGSIISARLATPVDSRTSEPGEVIEAVLVRPLFSKDQRLVFPAGSRLRGEVLDVQEARKLHRNGELAFSFKTIEAPFFPMSSSAPVRAITGRLVSVRVVGAMDDVRIADDGETRISESKMRFVAPAYALVNAGRAFGDDADSFERALAGAYHSKATKQIRGAEPGFGPGLAGSIPGAMIPPVGIGLGFFSAARAVYSTFLGRGQDIVFPAGTLIEIRLD